MKALTFIVWLILFIGLLDLGFELITKASAIENIIGLVIVAVTCIVSVKTKCLLNITLKRKEK